MRSRIPLAWLQLKREKFRLFVAIAGVSFAVILVFMQLGFRESVFESATRYHRVLDYDLVMLNPETAYLGMPNEFTRRRLYQALAAEEVESVSPIYMRQTFWKNPWEHNSRSIFVVGIDPSRRNFLKPDIVGHVFRIRRPDVVGLTRPPETSRVMPRKHHTADYIINKLREGDEIHGVVESRGRNRQGAV